jgi:hypothetical protein
LYKDEQSEYLCGKKHNDHKNGKQQNDFRHSLRGFFFILDKISFIIFKDKVLSDISEWGLAKRSYSIARDLDTE